MSSPSGSAGLDGKVAVVTGGTRGIGFGIAVGLLAEGASVVVCGRTSPASLPSADGRAAEFVAADVREPEQAASVIDFCVERFGRLDIAINNAGGAPYADAATVSPRFVAKIVALNLLAPFYVAQAANAVMQHQPEGGVIINIGSVVAVQPAPGAAAYAAAKGGLTALTKALALEFGPKVRVNQVTVGLVLTEMATEYYGDSEGQQAIAGLIPAGRLAVPGDVADACLLLASPLAGYVSGAELRLDGGGEIPGRFAVLGQLAGRLARPTEGSRASVTQPGRRRRAPTG